MSSTLPGIQDLLDKTLADLEVLLGVGDLIRDLQRSLTATTSLILGFKVKQKTRKIFSLHYSVFLFYFINMFLKTNKQERKK